MQFLCFFALISSPFLLWCFDWDSCFVRSGFMFAIICCIRPWFICRLGQTSLPWPGILFCKYFSADDLDCQIYRLCNVSVINISFIGRYLYLSTFNRKILFTVMVICYPWYWLWNIPNTKLTWKQGHWLTVYFWPKYQPLVLIPLSACYFCLCSFSWNPDLADSTPMYSPR